MKINYKNFFIKIPKHIILIYSKKKKIVIFIGLLNKKSLKLNVQLYLIKSKNFIKISSFSFVNISNNNKNKIKNFRNTTNALLKQFIIETSILLYQKLKLVGIGYKTFIVDNFKNKLLLFKLGYSHMIYVKIPELIAIKTVKLTSIYLFGNVSYNEITSLASLIRNVRLPEPYKGKGVLYSEEKITLKKGKKI